MLTFSAQAGEMQKLTVFLDWFINPDHGPLIIADAKGYFKDEGLDVTLIEPADPNDPPKLVAAGQGDIAISYQPQLHIFADTELPVVRIGTLVGTPLNSLVVLESSGITSIADLKGKKVGFSVGGFEDALLGAMLAKVGGKLSDVELINVNFALSPALMSGQVDAVIGAFRNFELNQLDIEGVKGLAFYPEEEGVPAYDELIYIARPDAATDPRMPAFMRAVEKAAHFIINHPDEAFALFAASKTGLDDELNKRAWADTLPRFSLSPSALDNARYKRFHAFMMDQGIVKRDVPLAKYAIELGQ
jgi:putative hydroxymethylpyrimidine transport system substrate-binding protein